MRAFVVGLLAATLLAGTLGTAASATTSVGQGAYAYASWLTGPFWFGSHADAHQQVSINLSEQRTLGSANRSSSRCFWVTSTIYVPEPSGVAGELLRQTAAYDCSAGDAHFSPSLDAASLQAITVPTFTWTWTDGVVSQPVPGSMTVAFEATATGRLEPFRELSCQPEDLPQCANTVTRTRPATASLWIDGVALESPTFAAIGWGLGVFRDAMPGVPRGDGADMIMGSGVRNNTTFDFRVVISPSGSTSGRFESTLMSNTGFPVAGDVDCGWVKGNVGVFGGQIEGADPASLDSHFTIMVSDGPDGMIIGNGQPDCGTDGFGVPDSLPISSGDIVVIDR